MGAEQVEERSSMGPCISPGTCCPGPPIVLRAGSSPLSAKRAPHCVSRAQERAQRGLTIHSHCVMSEHSYAGWTALLAGPAPSPAGIEAQSRGKRPTDSLGIPRSKLSYAHSGSSSLGMVRAQQSAGALPTADCPSGALEGATLPHRAQAVSIGTCLQPPYRTWSFRHTAAPWDIAWLQ